jgi:hypothetical protein
MSLLEIKSLKKSFVAPDDTRHLIVDVPGFPWTPGRRLRSPAKAARERRRS